MSGIAVAALAVSWFVVTPAEAAWSPTYGLSSRGWNGQDRPRVAVDRQGDALFGGNFAITWQQRNYRYQIRGRFGR